MTDSQLKSGLWMSHWIWLYFDLNYFIWVLAVMIRGRGLVGRWVTPVSSLLQVVYGFFPGMFSIYLHLSSSALSSFPVSAQEKKKDRDSYISLAWCCHHNLSLSRWCISFPHIYIILQTKNVFAFHPTRGNGLNRRCATRLRFLFVRLL